MNRITRLLSLLTALIFLPLFANARETVPVVNHDDIAVATGSGKPLTTDQVRDAIVDAAKVNRWAVSKIANKDILSATLVVNGKHTVVVSIPYSAEKFSIRYQDSVNMKYHLSGAPVEGSTDLTKINSPAKNVQADTPMIHPGYNKWVQALLQSIRQELRKL